MCGRFLDKYLITVRDKYTNRTLGDFEPYELGLTQMPADVIIFKDGDKAVGKNRKGEIVGESSSDHSFVWKKALAVAPERGIIFALGEFIFKTKVQVLKPIKIYGNASITASNEFSDEAVLQIGNGRDVFEDVEVAGIKVDGNKDNVAGGTVHGIQVKADGFTVSRVIIRNVYVKNCLSNGISLDSSAYSIVMGCIVENCNKGIYTESVSKISIVGNALIKNGSGIDIRNSGDITVVGNHTYQNNNGIEVSRSSRVVIVGNVFYDDKIGAHVYRNVNDEIVPVDILIVDNMFRGRSQMERAIQILRYSERVRVAHNKIYFDETAPENPYGIFFSAYGDSSPPSNWIVEGNDLYNAKNDGYGIWANGSGNVVRNRIFGFATKIQKYYFSGVVRDNEGYKTEASGIATIPAGSTSVTVSHGLVSKPSKAWITPLGQPAGKLWVENISDTSFDIVTDTAPSSELNIAWYAEV